MKIPVTTGDGRRLVLDSDDYLRLITLPDACSGIAPELWGMFAEEMPPQRRQVQVSPTVRRDTSTSSTRSTTRTGSNP